MKKSQILAALALAFALGVAVIPSASTYAQIVKDVNGIPVTDTETESKVQDAITAGKNSCGWHLVGTTKTYFYDQYLALNEQLADSADAVKAEEDSQYNGLKTVYATTLATFKGVLDGATPAVKLPSGLKTTFPEDVKTFKEAEAFINNMVSILKTNATKYRDNADTTIYDGYNAAINTFTGDNATTNKLLDAQNGVKTVKNTQAGSIEGKIVLITEADEDDDITYENAVAKANGLKSTENGTCSIAKVVNLEKAINYAQNLIDSTDNFTVSDAERAIANINKAQNGGTITDGDVKPGTGEGSNKPDQNAPDTGILANAEGSASTTVAMVAGIATALTAAGAGVVAYRNARRSSRK